MTGTIAGPDLAKLRALYLAAQLRGDRREALRVVMTEGLESGLSVRELSESVIGGAQREIGELWQRNELGIADEHMATAISNLVLAQLYERSEQAPANGKSILVACVEGELHELPARLVADALDAAGFSVRFLGASVPTDSLLDMIGKHRPDLLALSATMSFHASALRSAVERVRVAHPKLPIAVGGGACLWSSGLAEELRADATSTTASELVEVAQRLLGVRSR
ncbi:MAG TPA: cobalamin-dependent protein [Labilithrix sp.]|jgi:methanogenic corrinoid protein MtbC1|nr:cobalamin-dependent protein [Labilithrix sp.]